MLERLVRLSLLFDFYGPLLTERQRRFLELHYHEDWSLGEIAQHFGVSRQAVHDLLRRAEQALDSYEARLGLVERFWEQRRAVEELEATLSALREQVERLQETVRPGSVRALRLRLKEGEQALRRLAATV